MPRMTRRHGVGEGYEQRTGARRDPSERRPERHANPERQDHADGVPYGDGGRQLRDVESRHELPECGAG